MTSVYYDPDMGAFAVESGATLGEVYRKLFLGWGVTIPAGISPNIGVGGHVLGGSKRSVELGRDRLVRNHGKWCEHNSETDSPAAALYSTLFLPCHPSVKLELKGVLTAGAEADQRWASSPCVDMTLARKSAKGRRHVRQLAFYNLAQRYHLTNCMQ